MNPPLEVSAAQARRFLLRTHRIGVPQPGVGAVIEHHGYVQIDPINICGRMHDHILRNRVAGYREGDLMRHLHEDSRGEALAAEKRKAFEHHLPSNNILAAFPLSAWPHMQRAMDGRSRRPGAWSGKMTPRERDFSKRIFEALAEKGGLGPEAFADARRVRRVWGSATLAKSTLQKLFFHGRLLICGRRANRRLYDLPARVLPASILALPAPPPADTGRWLALTRLRQHRLVALTRAALALVEDLVRAVRVEGAPLLYCLSCDVPNFEPAGSKAQAPDTLLLAPLDPMIYDRRVTRHLWDFDYTWEAYMPASKRKRGYYALPVLAGCEIVGHVDLKADREGGRVGVLSRRVRRGHATAKAVGALARFLGLSAR